MEIFMVRLYRFFHAFSSCASKETFRTHLGDVYYKHNQYNRSMNDITSWRRIPLSDIEQGYAEIADSWLLIIFTCHPLSQAVYSGHRTDSFSHAAVGVFFTPLPQVAWPYPKHMTISRAIHFLKFREHRLIVLLKGDLLQRLVYSQFTLIIVTGLVQLRCFQSWSAHLIKYPPCNELNPLSGEIIWWDFYF